MRLTANESNSLITLKLGEMMLFSRFQRCGLTILNRLAIWLPRCSMMVTTITKQWAKDRIKSRPSILVKIAHKRLFFVGIRALEVSAKHKWVRFTKRLSLMLLSRRIAMRALLSRSQVRLPAVKNCLRAEALRFLAPRKIKTTCGVRTSIKNLTLRFTSKNDNSF